MNARLIGVTRNSPSPCPLPKGEGKKSANRGILGTTSVDFAMARLLRSGHMSHPRPATVGQLKETGYRPCSVKDELRRNLIKKLRSGEELFGGIIGYRDTVIPQIVNGVLSKHDLLFLGLRGQAKTRILRMLP